MKKKRVVFMGTPQYSVPVVSMLNDVCDVILVVTQPDKYVGRKKVLTPCPVKKFAISNGIKVISPSVLRNEYKEIVDLKPDIIITCAYGQILPEELIYAPLFDTVNVHASLLPKYRGGAPIHRAIINGEKEIGVSIMFTDKGMDSGDIIKTSSFEVSINDTYDDISLKMSKLGALLLLDVLPSIFDRTCKRMKQGDDYSLAPVIKREDEHIDFSCTSLDVHNKIRGLSSVPCGYAVLDGLNIKIILSSLDDCCTGDFGCGVITRVLKDSFFVGCSDGEVKILKIQFPGKKAMLVKDFFNGFDSSSLVGKVFK